VIRGGGQSGLDKCLLAQGAHGDACCGRALSNGVRDNGEETDRKYDGGRI
jgi:hypothetical protein